MPRLLGDPPQGQPRASSFDSPHLKKPFSRQVFRSKKKIASLWEQDAAEEITEATMVECDPREIDVGILSYCEPGSVCKKAPGFSSLGGFCVQNNARRLDGTIETSAPDYCFDESCDCTDFDYGQRLGTVTCTNFERCVLEESPEEQVCGVFPEIEYQFVPGPTSSSRTVTASACFQGNDTGNNYVCFGYTKTYDMVTSEDLSFDPNSCAVAINGCDCSCVYTDTACFESGTPGFEVDCSGISIYSFTCSADQFIKEASEADVADCGGISPPFAPTPPIGAPAGAPTPSTAEPPSEKPAVGPQAQGPTSYGPRRLTSAVHLTSVVMGAVLAWVLF